LKLDSKKRSREKASEKPLEFVAQKSAKESKKEDTNGHGSGNFEKQTGKDTTDGIEDNFRAVLGDMTGKHAEDSKVDNTKSNDDFRKMIEEIESGVLKSNKLFEPKKVSTKDMGGWEKHTKGKNQSSVMIDSKK
jgi:hypothetical protein